MHKHLHIIVKGRVQLVMFRDFTQRKARLHNIVGTVKNLNDGSVEILAEGDEIELESFIQKIHQGPVLARVDSVTISELSKSGDYKGFNILYK